MFQALPQIDVVGSAATLNKEAFDSCVFVFPPEFPKTSDVTVLSSEVNLFLARFAEADKTFGKELNVAINEHVPGAFLVTSPTGPLNRDYDDVRRYSDAVSKAMKRVRKSGKHRPLLIVHGPSQAILADADPLQDYSRYLEVSLLAALAESHDTLEVRETNEEHVKETAIEKIGIIAAGVDAQRIEEAIQFAKAVEEGRRVARDIGSPDSERMTALKAASYIEQYFAGSQIGCNVVSDLEELAREYPLLMAVARASLQVPRHAPCVVELSYRSPEQTEVSEELFFVGKGINYDTGGADLKTGGNMVGMSRDKCGAAAVAGLIATAARLQPKHVNIHARLAFVRNSIGPDSYVSDEVIKSRAGVRVRVGNTDAEGRMVMTDLLARAKEQVLSAGLTDRARLFTVATLTGHAARTYGPYVAALDNAAARRAGVSSRLFKTSLATGDMFEMSTLRREDFKIVAATDPAEDVLQANRSPSVATSRGHQYPMAFMITAAGLTAGKKETEADPSKIAYTHMDIAGAAEESGVGSLGRCTGAPIPTLSAALLFKRFATKLL